MNGKPYNRYAEGVTYVPALPERRPLALSEAPGRGDLLPAALGLAGQGAEPQQGEILFDGVPIRQVDPKELRERIALVLQDVFLFSRDVAYNIRLGDRSIDDARVVEAARVPVLVRGGGKEDLKSVLNKSAVLMNQGAKGMVYGRNIYQHANPTAVVSALMAMIHHGAEIACIRDLYLHTKGN